MSETKADNIDPSLPHQHVRRFLASVEPGPAFDLEFAALANLPVGPAYSTDLNAIVGALRVLGWWWHLSHLEATVVPTTPAPGIPANNSAGYDREGKPIKYSSMMADDPPAHALCEALVMAVYDLPAAYYVVASHTKEVLAKEPWSRRAMMAYYRAREDIRQEAIKRFETRNG